MANAFSPGFIARRKAAEAAITAKVTESLAVAGKTRTFSFPTKEALRKDPASAYVKTLEALLTDLGYVDTQLDSGETEVTDLTADLAAMTALKEAAEGNVTTLTADKATLQSTVDANALTLAAHVVTEGSMVNAILAQLEAAAILVINAVTDVAALDLMTAAETAGNNRAAVLTAITDRIAALQPE